MKRVLSLVLSVVLFVSVLSVSSQAVESEGWTDEKREEYLLKCQTDNLTFEEMFPVMNQDEKLASMIISWLDEVSEPIDGDGGNESISVMVAQQGAHSMLQTITRPDLSSDPDIRATVKLFLRTVTDVPYEATGYIIGDNTVVTAAHCMRSLTGDGKDGPFPNHSYMKQVMCIPATYPEERSYEPGTFKWWPKLGFALGDTDHVYVPDAWYYADKSYHTLIGSDYAIFTLKNKSSTFVGNSDSNMRLTETSTSLNNDSIFVKFVGYPCDLNQAPADSTIVEKISMHAGITKLNNFIDGDDFINNAYVFNMVGYPGMSGGPVFDDEGYFLGIYHGQVAFDSSGNVINAPAYGSEEYKTTDIRGACCGVTSAMAHQIYEYTQGSCWDHDARRWITSPYK